MVRTRRRDRMLHPPGSQPERLCFRAAGRSSDRIPSDRRCRRRAVRAPPWKSEGAVNRRHERSAARGTSTRWAVARRARLEIASAMSRPGLMRASACRVRHGGRNPTPYRGRRRRRVHAARGSNRHEVQRRAGHARLQAGRQRRTEAATLRRGCRRGRPGSLGAVSGRDAPSADVASALRPQPGHPSWKSRPDIAAAVREYRNRSKAAHGWDCSPQALPGSTTAWDASNDGAHPVRRCQLRSANARLIWLP